MNAPPLYLADHRAGVLYRLFRNALTTVDTGVLSEHAGVAQASPELAVWIDEAAGEVVLDTPSGSTRISTAVPAEHVAVDPSGRLALITPGLGLDLDPWNPVASFVDLEYGVAARFRTRPGEPGVGWVKDAATGELTAVLRHREPGAIEAIRIDELLALGPHVPPLRGEQCEDLAPDGHGDVAAGELFATATSRGLERFRVRNGRPEVAGIVPWPSPGRAHYLRLDAETGHALGVLRSGPGDPSRWADWGNALAWIDLHSGRARSLELPPGLAFRFGLGGDTAAIATIHPDGDHLSVLRRDAGGWRLAETRTLPTLSGSPRPGHVPWEGIAGAPAQRRSVAVSADGRWIAVTRGGDAQVHVLDAARHGSPMRTLAVPTSLDEGGIAFFREDTAGAAPAHADGLGR
ncbi:MAG: hypothetical protein LBE25_06290 [Arthrobacter sp.]|nr:hypothetical protein [Arthrobacter sp.]